MPARMKLPVLSRPIPHFARSLPPLFLSPPYRKLHNTSHDLPAITPSASHAPTASTTPHPPIPARSTPPPPPLSLLPLSTLIRSYLITNLSSSRLLLGPSLRILGLLAHSNSRFLNPDSNVLLRWVLKKTFYAQFCAGETREEVGRTVEGLKGRGFAGVILGYAREVVVEDEKAKLASEEVGMDKAEIEKEIEVWKRGTLETVEMTEKGDFVALKYARPRTNERAA